MELLSPSSKNKKKISSKKRSYIFRKWNFLALKLRNFLHFLERKEIGNPENIPYISGSTSKASKPKIS